MSGGRFDYKEGWIAEISETIQNEVIVSGKPIPKKYWDSYLREHPEEAFNSNYSESVVRRMEEAVYALKVAYIYARKIDRLIIGDTGEDSFERQLSHELAELNEKSKKGDGGVMYFPIDRTIDPYADD